MNKKIVRLAAVGDLHCTKTSHGKLQSLFQQIGQSADILPLCGDLVDYGLLEEATVLAKELAPLKIPMLAVLGNHEYESGQQHEVERILGEAGVVILDGDACEIDGIGFVGAKGFCGGFGEQALQPWGEESIKQFVQEAIQESLKLESGWQSCAPSSGSRCCTTRRSAPRWWANRRKSTPFSVRAGSKNPLTFIQSMRCSTVMPIAALPRGARKKTCRCSTWR